MEKDLIKIVEEYKEDLLEIYGKKFVSCYLYGSALTPSYVPGVSDLNFLIILSEVNINDLKAYSKVYKKWQKKQVSPPIIATPEYIRSSLDVFPLEFSEMKENHLLVYGADFLSGVEIPLENLRLQIESELKGKLLKFRQGIIFLSNDSTEYKNFFLRTVNSFLPIFRGVLRLYNVRVPYDFLELANKLSDITGFDKNILYEVWEIKKGGLISYDDLNNLCFYFHEEVEKLIIKIDKFKVNK